MLLREETMPRIVNSWLRLCTNVVPIPMSVVFGLRTRLCVHMCTKLENGILQNGQQPQSVVNGFYWPGLIWSYKVAEWLGSCASINFVLKSRWVLSFNKCSEQERKKERGKWHFCYCTLLRLAVFRVAFGHLYESCWSQKRSKRKPGRLSKLLACLWGSYTAFA